MGSAEIKKAQDRAVAVFGRLPVFEEQSRIVNAEERIGVAGELTDVAAAVKPYGLVLSAAMRLL